MKRGRYDFPDIFTAWLLLFALLPLFGMAAAVRLLVAGSLAAAARLSRAWHDLRNRLARRIGADVGGLWTVKTTVRKYREDIEEWRGREAEFFAQFTPYETVTVTRNGLLNEGINAIWTLVAGGSATAFSNANARLGVGDSSTAHSASQTDLQAATNKLYKAMDTSYPTYGTSQKITFKATFGSSEANFAWNEWSVDNGSSAAINLNRKVESLGTKSSGSWALTVEISLA